jgi:iron complex outermembrane receptor protein
LDSGDFREQSEGEFSGKVSVDFHVSDTAMIYAIVSRGYRSGSFNNGLVYSDQPNENGTYADPEFVDAYEVGVKSSFLAGQMHLNAALFYYDYQDQQFANQVGISAQLANAGGAEIRGAEVELVATLTNRITIRAGVGLLDTEYTQLSLPRLSTLLDPTDSIDLKGNNLVSSPDVNFNYAIDYEVPVGSNWSLRIDLNGSYLDDQWFSAYNDEDGHADIRQKAYWLHNARMIVRSTDNRLAFSVFGRNLFDESYDVFAINLQGGFGYNYFLEGRPGIYGVDFTYRY